MRLTFTLQSAYTGTTYVAGPFNISGTTSAGTTYWLATGVTKTQLTTGHSINTVFETLTGGTIASTGTCTTTRSWQISEPEPLTVTLQFYAKDEHTSPRATSLFYTKNAGAAVYMTTNSQLPPNSCQNITSITGLTLNDSIVISTDQTFPISGFGSSTCPTLSGTATTYTHVVGITSGTDYVAVSFNSAVSV
jgi:hypothetical protein